MKNQGLKDSILKKIVTKKGDEFNEANKTMKKMELHNRNLSKKELITENEKIEYYLSRFHLTHNS